MKNYHVIDATNDPVVTTYMDCIGKACASFGGVYDHLQFKSKPSRKDILINDSVLSALFYMFRGYKNNIVWIQGTIPEESFMRNQSKLRFSVLSTIEKYVLRRADFILFVSEEMKHHYEKKYNISFKNRCFIMPCFNEVNVEKKAFTNPQKYIENSMIYVGSLNKWQCFEETVSLVKKVQDISGTDIKFDVFTRDMELARSILEKKKVKNYHVNFVKSDLLKEHTLAYKYGFVLRKDDIVNRVATPTKFSNYISCGIVPIYSSCLKSFAEQDKKIKLGIVADIENDADINDAAEKIVKHMKEKSDIDKIPVKCEMYFSEYYNEEKYIKKMGKEISKIEWRSKV